MSWMGKWNGHTAGNWYGAVVAAVVAAIIRRAKFVVQRVDEIFIRKASDERTR